MERIEPLPLATLRESPFNPRKAYAEAQLRELADSLAEQGQLQPIVVRPLNGGESHPYEIVFGHRRFRAAQLAGMEFINAIARDMSDEQAALAQFHENDKRQGINAIEEADGYAHLQRGLGLAPAAIAKATGKSASTVYNALKLSRAHDTVRAAVLEEQCPPQLAVEVARLPASVQPAALKRLRLHDGGWESYRRAKMMVSTYLTPLMTDAQFALGDATLNDAGACTTCPKRTGNDPACDDLDPELCTDRACFDAKTEQHLNLRAEALRKEGHQVITGEEAARLMPYVGYVPRGMQSLAGAAFSEGAKTWSWAEALQRLPKKAPRPQQVCVVRADAGWLAAFLRDDDCAAVLKALKKDVESMAGHGNADMFHDDDDGDEGEGTPGAASRPDPLADYTPEQRAVFGNLRAPLIDAVLAAICATARTTEDLREVLRREYLLGGNLGSFIEGHFGIGEHRAAAEKAAEDAELEFEEFVWFEQWLAEQTADTLGAVVTAISVVEVLSGTFRPSRSQAERIVQLTARYGVNVLEFAGAES